MFVPLFAELKRRRVFRALIGYGIAAFAVLQVVEPIMHGLHWPDAVLSYVVAALAIGFPIVVSLAWIFDVVPDRADGSASGGLRGAPLALVLIGIGVLAAAPGVVWHFFLRGSPAATGDEALRATLEAVPPASDIREVPSIAVLPFLNLSSDKEQDYFSDGMTEEILNALAQVEGLRVIGRTSSFSFKGKSEDLRAIGSKLGAANLLEGSVRKVGNQVRITAQLVEARRGSHLWSQEFDRALTDVFAIQDEIAGAVVAALRLKLLPDRRTAAQEKRSVDPEVYNQVLLGRQFFNRSDVDGARRAVGAFEKALATDPGYAPAWAGLANANFHLARWAGGTVAVVVGAQERALAAAEKAVALAPGLADGYAARGRLRSIFRHDWKGGRADLERALSLNPSDVLSWSALALDALLPVGRLPEAVAAARKSTELDPLDAGAWGVLGMTMWYAGDIGQGRKALERALEISPENHWAAFELASAEVHAGLPAKALERFERIPLDWALFTGRALAMQDLGRSEESRQALEKLIAVDGGNAAYQVAEVFARQGDKDRAFSWLERADEQRDTGLKYVKSDPMLRNLRGDPRFAAFLRKMNLPPD